MRPAELESRADNEARLRPWPEQITVENVAAWIWSNATKPADSWPILQALMYEGIRARVWSSGCVIVPPIKPAESPADLDKI